MAVIIPARHGGGEQVQLSLHHGKMPPGDRYAVNKRDAGFFRHGGKARKVKVFDLCVEMDKDIGVFAVKKAQLLFKDLKIPVRENEPGVAHEKHSFQRFYYTERQRESQSACPRRRGEAH